jgi:hypothetical protein
MNVCNMHPQTHKYFFFILISGVQNIPVVLPWYYICIKCSLVLEQDNTKGGILRAFKSMQVFKISDKTAALSKTINLN